jgi:murein DD-endopeptidase MepM/ murein hydrolase activator NlpD
VFIIMDDEGLEEPRRHRIDPGRVLTVVGGLILAVAFVIVSVVLLSPVRGLIPGLSTAEMQNEARLNALRLQAVEDSLQSQEAYLTHLRDLMLGRIGGESENGLRMPSASSTVAGEIPAIARQPLSDNWSDHEQPALPLNQLPAEVATRLPAVQASNRVASVMQFPVLPPVNGLLTRGFDARIGHYAVDLAVAEGSVVRAIGDGYVVMADYTHEGGYVIAVQHAGGFLSVYKHNQRLLKREGDRVRAREAIATSGNTGEITTGPHLHFEVWRDGLAQDPSEYLLSL